jgi:hypothetical protein
MRTTTLALFGAAVCALASGSSDFRQSNKSAARRSLRPSKVLHAAPSKRSPATDDAQVSIVQQALTDPVKAAIAAQGLDGVKGNINGGDLADNTLIGGDSESAANPQENQYTWNYNVPFLPNANAVAGVGNETGWTALPQLEGFDLIRNTVITENATQVSDSDAGCMRVDTDQPLASLQPVYMTTGYNKALIKKAIIVMPGKVSVMSVAIS